MFAPAHRQTRPPQRRAEPHAPRQNALGTLVARVNGCINKAVDSSFIPWWQRIGLALSVFFRAVFVGRFAAWLAASRSSAAPAAAVRPEPPALATNDAEVARNTEAGAVLVLSLLQAEGRFIDFVQQDLAGFDDAEIGAVARVVHQGCGKVLHNYLSIEAIRAEPEGQSLRLPEGFDPSLVKLTGNIAGGRTVQGILRHKGWRASEVRLPQVVGGNGTRVLCPAEVEL
jgi:hypothetical protein